MQAWNALAATGLAARARRLPVLRHPVAGTLNAARFLGLFAVIAFLLAAAALALFVELADEIDADESLGRFDVALSNALRLHLPHDMLRFFSVITRLGDPEFLVALVAAVACGLLVVRRGALAAGTRRIRLPRMRGIVPAAGRGLRGRSDAGGVTRVLSEPHASACGTSGFLRPSRATAP